MKLTRRRMLALGAAGVVGTAGCLGNGGQNYETTTTNGVEVPLAPIGDTYDWYQDDEASFADARGSSQYDRAHIKGAVHSPAPEGGQNDPVAAWSKDTRVVCYCACPHHLSSIRASHLIKDGYKSVYVIDEGFRAWIDKGYPLAGSAVQRLPEPYRIEGRASADAAGEYAWAVHEPSDQQEAGPIAADGSWNMHLRFSDLTDDSLITVKTPDYRVEHPLGALRDGFVTADGSIRA